VIFAPRTKIGGRDRVREPIAKDGRNAKAQIIHVTNEAGAATARTVSGYWDHASILEDLDVRASDLLQANAVIWVEGPSDRTYVNHFISLWTDGVLREGLHYQCVFYGGSLRAHLSATDPDEADTYLKVLRVNRNAAILMDSDRESEARALQSTAQRLFERSLGLRGN
jgi:putative ATP-dependent endonuclease of OLD family